MEDAAGSFGWAGSCGMLNKGLTLYVESLRVQLSL